MLNILQAAHWVSKGESLQLRQGMFSKCGFTEKLHRFLSADREQKEIHKIISFIQEKLPKTEVVERKEYLKLANRIVRQNPKSHIARIFDSTILNYRPERTFLHAANIEGLKKWVRYGMSSEIYHKHPEFCRFAETSGLLSQMKVTRDKVFEIDGEPAINVNGKPVKWSELKEKFEVVYSKRYFETFIVHRQTSDVYTYLDNGHGLQIHHPFLTEMNPISVLDAQDYEKVIAKAKEFIRPGEENLTPEERQQRNLNRPFILQLVGSYTGGSDTNFHNFMMKPKHPYLRVIVGKDNPDVKTKKGDVFEVGYVLQKNRMSLSAMQGQFRSPDTGEYKSYDQKIVTNIPISQEEARALNQYTVKYHRSGVNIGNPIGFHFTRQNCATYVRHAMAVAGINVPTEIPLTTLIGEITPDWIIQIGLTYLKIKQSVTQGISRAVNFIPAFLRDGTSSLVNRISKFVRSIFESCIAFGLSFVHCILGNGKGRGGRAFVAPNDPPKDIKSEEKWFSLSSYRFNLPGVLQKWQRSQASTVLYDKPIKLTIVP